MNNYDRLPKVEPAKSRDTRSACMITFCFITIFFTMQAVFAVGSITSHIQQRKVDLSALCKGGIQPVKTGQVSSGQITAGEVRCWSVHLPTKHYMHVDVTQQGIDVVVQLYTGDGVAIGGEIDSPNGRGGEEPIHILSDSDANYVLAISSTDTDPVQPNYEVKIVESRPAESADSNFISAESAFVKGTLLYNEGTIIEAQNSKDPVVREKELSEAMNRYNAAIKLLGPASALLSTTEERGRQKLTEIFNITLDSHLRLGLLACKQKDLEQSLKQFEIVRAMAHEKNSAVAEIKTLILSRDCADTLGTTERSVPFQKLIDQFDDKFKAPAFEQMGDLYWSKGNYAAAIDAYSSAARLYHDLQARDGEVSVLTRIGQSYFDLGMFPQARTQYEEALKITGVSNKVSVIAKYNLGVVLAVLGESSEAFTALTEADRLIPETDVEAKIYALHSLGKLYINVGKYDTALELVQRALKLNNNRYENAAAYEYLYLGFIHLLQGQKQPGEQNTQLARNLWHNLNDPRGEANALYNLGHIAFDRGDFDTAATYANAALSLQENEPYGRAYSLTTLGRIALAHGNFEDARVKFDQALKLQSKSGDRQGALETLTAWSELEKRQDHLKEAETRINQAVDQLEQLRKEVPGVDLRASYFSTVIRIYKQRLDLYMQLYKQNHLEAYVESALADSDRMHARSLLDVVAREEIRASAVPEAKPLVQEQALLKRWNEAVIRRNVLLLSPHSSEQMSQAEKEVTARRTDWQRTRDTIDNDPRYALLTPKLLTAPEIKALLDKETLLLEFVLGKEQSYLWMVSSNGVQAFVLPPEQQIKNASEALLEAIRGGGGTTSNLGKTDKDTKFKTAADNLSKMLLGQIASQLRVKRLVIVGDGILHYIPFTALTDLSNTNGEWQPLLIDHVIITSPSAAVSAALEGRSLGRGSATKLLAVLGDPLYEIGDSTISESVQTSVRQRASALLGSRDVYLPFLKYEVDEIEKSKKAHASGEESIFVRQEQVTVETATSENLKQYRIIHYAAHGVFDDQSPETSGLLLSLYDGQHRPRQDDIFLSVPRVYRMSIAADLVVLSACQSALGPEIKGEGITGLTRAFMHAGSQRVISSLWVVNDARTSRLMKEFYRQLVELNVTQPAEALREAQKLLYQQGEGPKIWAAFQMQGEWRKPIQIRSLPRS